MNLKTQYNFVVNKNATTVHNFNSGHGHSHNSHGHSHDGHAHNNHGHSHLEGSGSKIMQGKWTWIGKL